MEWAVRPWASQQDLEHFYAATFELAKTYRFTPQQLAEWPESRLYEEHRADLASIDFRSPDRGLLLAETKSGAFLGVVWVATRGRGDAWDRCDRLPAWVYDIQVSPQYRRHGIGKALMLAAEDWAREHGHCEIGLHTIPQLQGAVTLYTSLGYQDDALVVGKTPRLTEHPEVPQGIEIVRWRQEMGGGMLTPMWELRGQVFGDLTAHDHIERQAEAKTALYPHFKPTLPVAEPGYITLVAQDMDRGKAYAGGLVARNLDGAWWILELGVVPLWRRRGIARALLQCLEGLSLSEGRSDLKAFHNVRCREVGALLASEGYGVTDYYMRKPVSPTPWRSSASYLPGRHYGDR